MLSRPMSSLYLFFVAFLFILHSVKASSSDSAGGSVSLSDSPDDGEDGTIIDPALLALLEAANGGPIDPVVLAQVVLAANILDIPLDGIESAEQVAALLALLNQFTPSPPPTNPPTNPTPAPTSPTPPPTNPTPMPTPPTPAPVDPAPPAPTASPVDPPAPTAAPVDPPAPTAAPVDAAPPTEPVTTQPGATAAPTGSPVTVSPTTSLPTTSAPTAGNGALDGALNRAKEAPKVGMPAGNLQQIAGCPCDFSLGNFQANCDAMTCEYATTKDLGLLQCGTKIFGVTTGSKGRCGDNSSGNGNAVLTENQGRECLEDFKASAAGTGCKDSSPKPKPPPAA